MSTQTTPDGWKLVPIKPTDRMLQAAAEFWLCEEEMPRRASTERKLAMGYWEAMIDETPEPPNA